MLIKFNSSVTGEMLMHADTARGLLEIVGKACTARGVLPLEQLPTALQRLRHALAEASGARQADDESNEPPIGLMQRAHPFIEMLERTLRGEGFVLWEAPQDF
jgi:hypothetical protein